MDEKGGFLPVHRAADFIFRVFKIAEDQESSSGILRNHQIMADTPGGTEDTGGIVVVENPDVSLIAEETPEFPERLERRVIQSRIGRM